MAYVSEKSPAQTRVLTSTTNGVGAYSRAFASGRSRTQYGYRSNNLSVEEQRSIEDRMDSWGDVVSHLSYLDEVGFSYRARAERAWTVHDRNYSELKYSPAQMRAVYLLRQKTPPKPWTQTDLVGSFGFTPSSGFAFPTLPSDAQCVALAAPLMRNSVPNTRAFNLVRALAEQRDAPRLARGLSLKGMDPRVFSATNAGSLTKGLRAGKRISKKAGELYLSWVFGIKPTASDLMQAADAVIRLDGGIRNYLGLDQVRTRSKRGITLFEASGADSIKLPYNASGVLKEAGFAGFKLSFDRLMNHSDWRGLLAYKYTARQWLSQFATWEFFVPRPADIHNRLGAYASKAEALLGEGASAGTVYDLTPWTWLVDWFVDVGGVLHYQQQLADNQVSATSNGWSVFQTAEAEVTHAGFVFDHSGSVGIPETEMSQCMLYSGTATYSSRVHRRRSGNPYSLAPTWVLDPQQSAILSALGLAKGR